MKRAEELAFVETAMRERGYRWTSQRRLVTKVALGCHEHMHAEELLALCRKHDPTISRATIYRTLLMLEDAGFVAGLDTGDGGRRFEHTLGHEHHDHMVCTACGRILEFRDDEVERLQEAAARRRGFTITSHTLKLFGICAECASRGVRPKKRQRIS